MFHWFQYQRWLDSSVLALVNNDNNNGYKWVHFYMDNPEYDELPWVEMMIAKTKTLW
jgi:asparagine synthase (glutamine-hydrolysing)